MSFNGNSYENEKPHHLYIIFDKETGDLDKYGISSEPIESGGLSSRIKIQLDLFNRIAGWHRFYAEILYHDIPNRIAARQIEKKFINAYIEVYGHRPPGNLTS